MDQIFTLVSPELFLGCIAVTLLAGFVKGVVGFAMPMIMISGLGSLIAPELALAAVIVPTLLSNGWQALRQGPREAAKSIWEFRVFLIAGFITLAISAQLVSVLSAETMYVLIGGPVSVFVGLQLLGWKPRLTGPRSKPIEATIGSFAGFIGGFSGIWGPPTILYLGALDTPKRDQIRIQGVIYGLGAVALFGAHIISGVVRVETFLFSLLMMVPAMTGMWFGFKIQDRIDQAMFRRATQIVLLVAGLNLLRRGIMG